LTTNRPSKSTSTNRENHAETHPRACIQGLHIKEIAVARHHDTRPDPKARTRPAAPIQDARVHYAVPKQQPRHTHHTHTQETSCNVYGLGHARDNRNNVHQGPPRKGKNPDVLLPQDPTVRHGPTPAQQPAPFQPRIQGHAAYWGPITLRHRPRFVDIPPMSTRRTTQGSAAGHTEHPHPATEDRTPGVSCSLERR